MNFFDVLNYITAPNSDNGRYFLVDQRLEKIDQLLFNTKYRKVNPDGLFVLYAAKPIHEIDHPIIVSSHVDCVPENMNCFVEYVDQETVRGTFDNLVTNAAILNLMVNNELPDNVLIAFTGDEENESKGARHLSKFLSKRQLKALIVVLDVTDMGWKEGADFSIENNFWKTPFGTSVMSVVQKQECNWVFVPSDPDAIPAYVPQNHVFHIEAEEDESWEYDEQGIECFSFCLPVYGDMHDRRGVIVRKNACLKYIKALKSIVSVI